MVLRLRADAMQDQDHDTLDIMEEKLNMLEVELCRARCRTRAVMVFIACLLGLLLFRVNEFASVCISFFIASLVWAKGNEKAEAIMRNRILRSHDRER